MKTITPTNFFTAAPIFDSSAAYDIYDCVIRLDSIVGGQPSNPQVMSTWLKMKLSEADSAVMLRQRMVEMFPAEMMQIADLPEAERDAAVLGLVDKFSESVNGSVFRRDDFDRPCIEGRQIKAMFKESANIAYPYSPTRKFGSYKKTVKPKKGEEETETKTADTGGKSLIAYLAERVFIPEFLIALEFQDGQEVQREVRPIHVTDMRGNKINALKTYEIAYNVIVRFTLKIDKLSRTDLTEEVVRDVMLRAQENGLGADRSQSAGRFQFVQFEKR
jgi:hypothetical protein